MEGAVDPWEMVTNELLNSLEKLKLTHKKFKEVRASKEGASHKDLPILIREVLRQADAIELDLDDTQNAMEGVSSNREAWRQVTDRDLEARAEFLRDTRRAVETMRREASAASTTPSVGNSWSGAMSQHKGPAPSASALGRPSEAQEEPEQADESATKFLKAQLEKQREMEKVQDEQLIHVERAVMRVNETAKAIKDELYAQDRLLDDLENNMENLDTKLKAVTRKMDNLLEQMSDKGKFCCLGIMVLILVAVLIMFFLF